MYLTAAAPGTHTSPPAQTHPESLPAPIQDTLSAQPHPDSMSGPIKATLGLLPSLEMHSAAAKHAEHARKAEYTVHLECVSQAEHAG